MITVEKLVNFLENDANVIFSVIFGSYATGRYKKESDIDMGIFLGNLRKDLTCSTSYTGCLNLREGMLM